MPLQIKIKARRQPTYKSSFYTTSSCWRSSLWICKRWSSTGTSTRSPFSSSCPTSSSQIGRTITLLLLITPWTTMGIDCTSCLIWHTRLSACSVWRQSAVKSKLCHSSKQWWVTMISSRRSQQRTRTSAISCSSLRGKSSCTCPKWKARTIRGLNRSTSRKRVNTSSIWWWARAVRHWTPTRWVF